MDATKKMTAKSRDWHARLTMLQLIMNTFWDGFLQSVMIKLAWKRIRQDCRNCYFQASYLVQYVYHELLKIMMEQFVLNLASRLETKFDHHSTDQSKCKLLLFCWQTMWTLVVRHARFERQMDMHMLFLSSPSK